MPVEVSCTACGRSYRLADELAGKKFRCKGCDELVLIAARNSDRSTNSGTRATGGPATPAKPATAARPTAAAKPERKSVTPGSTAGKRQPVKERREEQRAPRATSGRDNRARSRERGSVRGRSTESADFDDLPEYEEAAADPWESQPALPQRRGRRTGSQSTRPQRSTGAQWSTSTWIAVAAGGLVVVFGVSVFLMRALSSDSDEWEALTGKDNDPVATIPMKPDGGNASSSAADNTAQDSAIRLADLCTSLYDALRETDRRLPPAGQPALTPDQQRQILLDAGINDVRTGGQTLGMHLKQTGSPGKFPIVAEAFRDQANEKLRHAESTLQQLQGRLDPGLISVLRLWHAELTKQSGILWRRHAKQ